MSDNMGAIYSKGLCKNFQLLGRLHAWLGTQEPPAQSLQSRSCQAHAMKVCCKLWVLVDWLTPAAK